MPPPRSKHLQGAVEVQQAFACLHGDPGGLVYPDLCHQGLWLGIRLSHLQKPGSSPQGQPSDWWPQLKPGVRHEIGDFYLAYRKQDMQRLGYVYQEIKETKQSGYFYIGHRKYNAQKLSCLHTGSKEYCMETLG